MLGETNPSIVEILMYAIFFAVMLLLSLIPAVIHAFGLARICKKLGAFRPVWSWVWSFVFPAFAILRAGDIAAERDKPGDCRKNFEAGVTSVIAFALLMALALGFGLMTAFSTETPQLSVITKLFALVMIVLLIAAIAISVWLVVLLYISYFRIFKLYMPTWGAWLTLIGMFALSQFAFLILPVLSFLPMRDD